MLGRRSYTCTIRAPENDGQFDLTAKHVTNFSGLIAEFIHTTGYKVSTFGQDEAGNLYLTDYSAGDIYMITE